MMMILLAEAESAGLICEFDQLIAFTKSESCLAV